MAFGYFFQTYDPIFFEMIKEAVEIHVVHQCYLDHCGQPRKTP